MGYISLYGDQLMLASLLTPNASLSIDTFYVALLTDLPDKNLTDASQLSEPLASYGYVRESYNSGYDNWSSSVGVFYNTKDIVWPTPTGDWGRIVGWALCDSPDVGNIIAIGVLSPESTISAYSNVYIPANSLRLKLV